MTQDHRPDNQRAKEKVAVSFQPAEISFIDTVIREVFVPAGYTLTTDEAVRILVLAFQECYRDSSEEAAAVSLKDRCIRKLLEVMSHCAERRKFLRLKKSFIAGFCKIETAGSFTHGLTANVSLGGFKIDVPYLITPLSCGQSIEIALKPESQEQEPLKGVGKVVWLKRKEPGNGYEIGIMITHIREEDIDKLRQYLEDDSPSAPKI